MVVKVTGLLDRNQKKYKSQNMSIFIGRCLLKSHLVKILIKWMFNSLLKFNICLVGPAIGFVIKEIQALQLWFNTCLLYTSDAADDIQSVDLGGRPIA